MDKYYFFEDVSTEQPKQTSEAQGYLIQLSAIASFTRRYGNFMRQPKTEEMLISQKLASLTYSLNQFFIMLNQMKDELDQIRTSIIEGISVVLKDTISSSSLYFLKGVSFEVRLTYLEQALSYYPETISLNLNDSDRKVLSALMIGECTRHQLTKDVKIKWKNVDIILNKLIELKLVEPVIYEQGWDRYHLTKEFAHKLERALHMILGL